jgi:3',5'-cyclic AMP phosphodiesterase CpdA
LEGNSPGHCALSFDKAEINEWRPLIAALDNARLRRNRRRRSAIRGRNPHAYCPDQRRRLKLSGQLACQRVGAAQMLKACVDALTWLDPQPDLIVHTGDLTDLGRPEEYDYL